MVTSTGSQAGRSTRRYRGLSPDERRQERRRRLLDAGLELFGTLGYHGVSIDRLCTTAGVTARHFYEEFPSREVVLAAVADEIAHDILAQVGTAVLTSADDPESRARCGLTAAMEGLLGDPRRARVFLIETSSGFTDIAERQRVIHTFVSLVENEATRLVEAGLMPRRDVHLAATVVIAATVELLIEQVSGRGHMAIPELVDELVRIFLAVVYFDLKDVPRPG